MNIANFTFYAILFVGFFLPTNSNMYIPFPGVPLKVNELAFLLLPFVNIFCTSRYKRFRLDRRLAKYIILYLLIVAVTEFIFKPIVFSQSIEDSFKGFRRGIPLYSSLILLYSGVRVDIKTVWKILLIAIGTSVTLSFVSLFISLPIYYNMEEEDVLTAFEGRILNSNAAFGIIGLYLLFTDKDKWYNQGKLVKYVSILSVIALVITFNRTYLALLTLEFLYLAYKSFSLRSFFKILLYPALLIGIAYYSYNKFDTIQRQIDRRILSIVFQKTTLVESTIENNRDVIYTGIAEKVKEGYWAIGLPYYKPIFINIHIILKEPIPMYITDTSLANVLLRYGIIPLILFCMIFYRLFRISKSQHILRTILTIYFIASFNIDSLFRHNSVFFFIIIYFVIRQLHGREKNRFYNQNQLK